MGTSLETLHIPLFDSQLFDDSLLCSGTLDRYESEAREALLRVTDQLAAVESPTTGPYPEDLRGLVDAIDLDSPLGSNAESFDELKKIYLRDAVYFHHPKYAAHLNCPVAIPAVAAEAFVTSLNTSMDTFDQSAGATLIERRLTAWTAQLIGFPELAADGIFTSGGTQSNLQAMLIARNAAVSKTSGPLPQRLQNLRIYTSQDAHFSISNAAMMLGLGHEAAVGIETDGHHRMDAGKLREQIAHDLNRGLVPMAISATAGTTDFGAIDPLGPIAALANEVGAWFHVDAAYGGGLLLSSSHRERLSGIELADSVTVDFHKSFFQPIGSSALILHEADSFESIAHYAEYLNPKSQAQQTPNQVDKSLQTTRRFDALKLWVTLRTLGAVRLGTMFDRVIELAESLEAEVSLRPQLELAAPVQLSTLVFSFKAPGNHLDCSEMNELTNQIRQRLYRTGEAMIAATTVDGRRMLKLTLLNPNTTMEDLTEILDAICRVGNDLLLERLEGARA
ncbi:pyridoxal phosphate-dependent decarboxylase family protein [Glutamicibacter sp. AOP38-B1-38]|uniref:pyridoxal phosphate-dependent decarboxylase family protein n=1 Tax=Glutamicibacter sp. AOP38-B1-38 TaxID=3457680 RepID=UPI004033F57F